MKKAITAALAILALAGIAGAQDDPIINALLTRGNVLVGNCENIVPADTLASLTANFDALACGTANPMFTDSFRMLMQTAFWEIETTKIESWRDTGTSQVVNFYVHRGGRPSAYAIEITQTGQTEVTILIARLDG